MDAKKAIWYAVKVDDDDELRYASPDMGYIERMIKFEERIAAKRGRTVVCTIVELGMVDA